MKRKPIPGEDKGEWGQILNEFLDVSLTSDGKLKPSTVTSSTIADNSISETKLDPATRAKLNNPGPQGAPGTPGASGTQGPQGAQGPAGADGDDGLSAYELAVNNGFSGTLEQWLDSLKGDEGSSTTSWDDIQNKPTNFNPTAHNHGISDITNLQANLNEKITHTTESYRVYATNGDSELVPLVWSSTNTGPYTVPVRDDAGRIAAAAPTGPTHATTKSYVDSALSTKANTTHSHSFSDLPTGLTMAVVNTDGTQPRPTSSASVVVLWIGGTVEPVNALAHDIWFEEGL